MKRSISIWANHVEIWILKIFSGVFVIIESHSLAVKIDIWNISINWQFLPDTPDLISVSRKIRLIFFYLLKIYYIVMIFIYCIIFYRIFFFYHKFIFLSFNKFSCLSSTFIFFLVRINIFVDLNIGKKKNVLT